jgi:predicted TIM-barrel fold metal-dependent hydrolase
MSRPHRHPVDVHSYIGPYPFRHVPHPDPAVLVRVIEREGIGSAWVGHLPTAFHRDPGHGNGELYRALGPHRDRLHPAPVVRPDWPNWLRELERALAEGAPAVRAYPPQWGYGADDSPLIDLAHACAAARVVLLLTTRFEDLRQRSRLDVAGDLAPAAVRAVVRSSRAAVVVTAAGRDFVEEVHWGLTPFEQRRLWWDLSWIWGPPENHLAHLLRTMGAERFVFGTGWPLRLTQAPSANLALLPDPTVATTLADPRTLAQLTAADDIASTVR